MPARGGRGCLDELAEGAGNGSQLLGRTALGHAGTGLGRFKEDDLVGLANGGQTVGHHDDGAALGELAHHLGNGGLVLPVQGRGDLVEQQDGGVLDEGPGDGDALTLPTGQAQPAGTDLRVPPAREGYTMAETVLDVLRGDEGFSREEAMMLDVMLMLHAEHGGGNNSSFTCRVLSSSGTDAYSAYAAAIGSLKGPRHGGANYKAGEMIDDVAEHVRDWSSDTEVADYLTQILNRQAFDRTGLIYGLGHAVYTVTDPRAEVVRHYARTLAERKGQLDKLELIGRVERLGPQLMRDVRGITKPISTNIDLYTGFVYAMLGIPRDLYTPIFALARMSGWAAHRMEELYGPARIIRPAYNSYMTDQSYVPLAERA